MLACLAFNLTRAAGALASRYHGRATTATVRDGLVDIPARQQVLHLPEGWPWSAAAAGLFDTLHAPPLAA